MASTSRFCVTSHSPSRLTLEKRSPYVSISGCGRDTACLPRTLSLPRCFGRACRRNDAVRELMRARNKRRRNCAPSSKTAVRQLVPACSTTWHSTTADAGDSSWKHFCSIRTHRSYRYLGLCSGAPGIGKSLSALHYSREEHLNSDDQWSAEAKDEPPINTVLYTPECSTRSQPLTRDYAAVVKRS